MRHFSSPSVFLVSALLVAPAGLVSSGTTDEPAAPIPTCERFTLEGVRLGMTRSEVEALSIGKIDVVGEATDSLRLQVAAPGKKLQIGLVRDHVQLIELVHTPDKKRAGAILDDLRARWGEPDKDETTTPEKRSPYQRPGHEWHIYKWTVRSCQAHGYYKYSGSGLYVALATSTDSIRSY